MTRLTVSIVVESLEQGLAQARLAQERGADLVEFRIDHFTADPEAVVRLIDASPLPCLLTCRPEWEGGEYEGDDTARLAVWQEVARARAVEPSQGQDRLAANRPAYLDVELAAFQRGGDVQRAVKRVVDHPGQVGEVETGLILSTHDFQGRPADLLQKVEAMLAAPACRVIKLAWRARSLRDNLEAFELIAASHKPTIALCMGEYGFPSRILSRKFNALMTFAGLDDRAVTAPGQVGVSTMRKLYRWDAINGQTQVFGVIGDPVGHSLSPHVMNAGFEATGFNGVYLPLPIPPEYEHFKATVGAWLDCGPLDFRGASVTIPHKQNLLRFVTESGGEVEPLAARIGAANTLTVRPDGGLLASNTDYAAALDAVAAAMGTGRQGLGDVAAAVIGAGGAARAVVAGLAACGARVVIHNRTLQRAQELADQFNEDGRVSAAPLADLAGSDARVFVNCTSLGMHPDVDATPMPVLPPGLGDGTVVFDTVYNPAETRWLREAAAAGATTVSGLEMFVRQAAAQFELWTEEKAPRDHFEQVVRQRLDGAAE